jgi:4-alpha-glucanotransferase
MDAATRKAVCDYLDISTRSDQRLRQAVLTTAMRSCAHTCIIPMQDILGLDSSCRMNLPGTVGANWRWRLTPGSATAKHAAELLAMTRRYGRANRETPEERSEAKWND